MAKQLKAGDTVCFTGDVIRRTGHSPEIVQFRATVESIEGRLASTLDDSGKSKLIPIANLAKVASNGVILDLP